MTDNDEQTLVQRAQRDPQAFASLYDRYVDRIYTYALHQTSDEATAQDVTSATFEKALRHIRRYRWQGQSFCAWLYRIARNEMVAIHRKQRLLAPLSWLLPDKATVDQTHENRQQSDEIQAAMSRLSASDREVIQLRYFNDLSNAEIATIIGCSLQTLYVRTYRALARLRKVLEQAGNATSEGPYRSGECPYKPGVGSVKAGMEEHTNENRT